MPTDRLLARTALTFATAAATALSGCGKEEAQQPPNVAPMYGVPAVMDASPEPAPTATTISSGTSSAKPSQPPPQQFAPAYGVPPINRPTPPKQ
jgi:hypothetical protein